MGRPRTITHGRKCYINGCRCPVCCEAEAVYQKTRRHGTDEAVTDTSERVPGVNESAVQAEIAGLAMTESRPGIAEAALTMARVLDNRLAIAQHPQAANRLESLLDKLHRGGDVRGGRLASVKKIGSRAS